MNGYVSTLYADPDDADDDVHALTLTAVVLETPHAVCLLVPKGLGRRVHATSTHVRFSIGSRRGGRVAARADMGFVGLRIAAALGLVEGRGRYQVLHDGTVDDELEGGRLRARGRGLRDDGSENGVLTRAKGNSC